MKFKVGDIVRRTYTSFHSSQYGVGKGDMGVVISIKLMNSVVVRYFKGPVISNSHDRIELVKPDDK